jgi:hypothetical protein
MSEPKVTKEEILEFIDMVLSDIVMHRINGSPYHYHLQNDKRFQAIRPLIERYFKVLALVQIQAEDEGLWFISETASEAYLQRGLRELHATIEGDNKEER